jgi:hypothetical protein
MVKNSIGISPITDNVGIFKNSAIRGLKTRNIRDRMHAVMRSCFSPFLKRWPIFPFSSLALKLDVERSRAQNPQTSPWRGQPRVIKHKS